MPDRYGNDHAHTVEDTASAPPRWTTLIVLMTMSAVTTKLGLASTCIHSTLPPSRFDVARRFRDDST